MAVESVEDFQGLVREVEAAQGYRRPAAFGIGLATFSIDDLRHPSELAADACVLDTWYPAPCRHEGHGVAAVLSRIVGHQGGTASYRLSTGQLDDALQALSPFVDDGAEHPNLTALQQLRATLTRQSLNAEAYQRSECTLDQVVPRAVVVSFIGDLEDAPVDAHDAYLRLHLISARKVVPHGVSLAGVFGLLSNVVWTNVGPFEVAGFERVRGLLRSQGVSVQVHSVDKFPRMIDYVSPTGVRVADADRVRLGAHLGSGTTVMHEGFVNFNAGTLGKSMVEGRISAGVTVGDGSDVGGGASLMGTLSGGGDMVISVGEGCLLGANAGCGIPLGDGCTIEAGLYVTSGSKVSLPDGRVVKARELSGQNDLLFRRNSQSGAIEVVSKRNEIVLNAALHDN